MMDMSLQRTLEESLDKILAHRAELQRNLDQVDETANGLRKLLTNITDGSGGRPATTAAPRVQWQAASPPSNGSVSVGGLHGGLSRRQVILRQIIPEFGGEAFSPRDVRVKYLEMYPEQNSKSLSPTVSSLLREMAEKDEIERVGRGNKSTDPWMYRAKEDDEETLLRPSS